MIDIHSVLIVVVAVLATLLTRFLPFWIFRGGRKIPQIVTDLGKVLPYAIMGMLVVYCLKDVTPLAYPYSIPELLGCGAVVALHVWKRNSLLSIGAGTAFYMILVQLVF